MNENNVKIWFWALLDVFIAVAVLTAVFFVMPAVSRWKNSFMPVRTVTVSAEGKTAAAPDLAETSFSVVSRGKDPANLDADNNGKMTAVIAFVKSQGIGDKDIATTAYDLSPDYRYDTALNRNYITGYTLTQTVSVKIRDLAKVAGIIGGLTPLGVNQIGGINFTFDDEEKFLAVARADALLKAKTKAAAMAAEAGASLGEVISVGENGMIPMYQSYGIAKNMMSLAGMNAAPTIEPGTHDVTDNVTITYELK